MNERCKTYDGPRPMSWDWVALAEWLAEDYLFRGHKAADHCPEESCFFCPLGAEDCPSSWLDEEAKHAAYDAEDARKEWTDRVARWPAVVGFAPSEY